MSNLLEHPQAKESGIYALVNTINGKVYIGQAKNTFYQRWWRHIHDLDRGKHHCKGLQHDWSLYGSSAFRIEVLEVIQDWHADFCGRERFHMSKWRYPEERYNNWFRI